jgi:hypothetical protein
MLAYTMMVPEGILELKPDAPLSKEDFSGLSAVVDSYLSTHDKLQGVLIHAKTFPGWDDFGGFTAHMHFVRAYHEQVKRVAVVTDSSIAGLAESLGRHFTSAEVKHFPFSNETAALVWLKTV